NTFLNQTQHNADFYYTQYVADAQGYPFSVVQYTPDNTGRVRRDGESGQTLQTGSGKDKRYYYGKPTATELERLFGLEAGNSSHYVKNMVIDPNGQATVSYADIKGKTVATAMVGAAPPGMDPLPNAQAAITTFDEKFLKPEDFTVNTGALNMSASST